MGWRNVIISKRCKLDLKMGYMVVRSDEIIRIHLDELAVLVIENNAVSITGCLLEELANKKVKVIFCDGKRNPVTEMIPIYGSYDSTSKIRRQIKWSENIKSIVWTEIVADKIKKQAEHLEDIGRMLEGSMLRKYIDEMEIGDATNREGHAAKVYFNCLFGKDFSRTGNNAINAGLNYGYGILLALFNREIVSSGYLTQLGIFHDNTFNHFNLSCDFMEPFRIIVDRIVMENQFSIFEKEQKYIMLEMLNKKIEIDGALHYLPNAVKIYCRSIFNALNENDSSLIRFYKYEL